MLHDKKIIIASVIYVLCLYQVFIFYSPHTSVNAIKQALQQKDVETLDEYIDFNSIQLSVIAQLKTEIMLNTSEYKKLSGTPNPLLMSTVAIAIKMVEDFIEVFLSKNGLSQLYEMEENSSNVAVAKNAKKYISSLQSETFLNDDTFKVKSFRTIEVAGSSKSGKKYKFVFTFRYTKWILTDIVIDLQNVNNEEIIGFIRAFQSS